MISKDKLLFKKQLCTVEVLIIGCPIKMNVLNSCVSSVMCRYSGIHLIGEENEMPGIHNRSKISEQSVGSQP